MLSRVEYVDPSGCQTESGDVAFISWVVWVEAGSYRAVFYGDRVKVGERKARARGWVWRAGPWW